MLSHSENFSRDSQDIYTSKINRQPFTLTRRNSVDSSTNLVLNIHKTATVKYSALPSTKLIATNSVETNKLINDDDAANQSRIYVKDVYVQVNPGNYVNDDGDVDNNHGVNNTGFQENGYDFTIKRNKRPKTVQQHQQWQQINPTISSMNDEMNESINLNCPHMGRPTSLIETHRTIYGQIASTLQITDKQIINNHNNKTIALKKTKRPFIWLKPYNSSNNLCNGSITTNHILAPKVPNNNNCSPNGQKKGQVSLSHLPQRPPVDIEFCDISYSVSDSRRRGFKTILKGVSGKFRNGELTAIMGPSGAGKSTLMNILAGYKTSQLSGTVMINGKERNLRRFRKLSCYIMQDDVLIANLSVRESMMVSANLKLGKNMDISAKKVVVDEILETIGLIESSNTKTCNLSGGQRKRLSIALELVNNPPVMFFDEPTSGLDSSTCFQLISLLKSLARGGRTIVCTIHQPSARLFEKFDHLYLLGEGQCLYEGRVKGLVNYLACLGYECPSYHNPADYVLEVTSGEYGNCVPKMVQAVKSGMCKKYSQKNYGLDSLPKDINNDIIKGSNSVTANNNSLNTTTLIIENEKRIKNEPTTSDLEMSIFSNHSNITAGGGGDDGASVAILKPVKLESQQSQQSDCTVINMPRSENGTSALDDNCSFSSKDGRSVHAVNSLNVLGMGQNMTKTASGGIGIEANIVHNNAAGCTTSLLDSHESVITLPNKSGFPTSGWTQFWILLKRSFVTIIRDRMLTHMRLASHIIVGAIIGMIYYDVGNEASKVMSNAGCIFFTTMFTMFTAMMPTILTFPTEMSVFVREHLNYWYSLKAFYFAKTMADLPFQIMFSSVYVIVVYYLTSQPMEWQRVSMFVFICVLTSLVAQSLGLLIGAGMNIEAGVFLGPVTTIPTILFSGFFVNFDTIPGYLQWVTYISYVRYGFEGAMVSIYGMNRDKLQCNAMYCHFRSPKKFLEEMSMDHAEYWIDAVALIGTFIALRIIAYFVLRWKLHMIR